jgi:hypothetical protein
MILNLDVFPGSAPRAAMAARLAIVSGRVFPAKKKKVKSTLASRAKRYLRRLDSCLVKAAAVRSSGPGESSAT